MSGGRSVARLDVLWLAALAMASACDRGGVCERDEGFTCWSLGMTGASCTELGCTWRAACAPIRCSTRSDEAGCQSLAHCYWSGQSCSIFDVGASCETDGAVCGAVAGCIEELACLGDVDCSKHTSSSACGKSGPLCRWNELRGPIRTGRRPTTAHGEALVCVTRADARRVE